MEIKPNNPIPNPDRESKNGKIENLEEKIKQVWNIWTHPNHIKEISYLTPEDRQEVDRLVRAFLNEVDYCVNILGKINSIKVPDGYNNPYKSEHLYWGTAYTQISEQEHLKRKNMLTEAIEQTPLMRCLLPNAIRDQDPQNTDTQVLITNPIKIENDGQVYFSEKSDFVCLFWSGRCGYGLADVRPVTYSFYLEIKKGGALYKSLYKNIGNTLFPFVLQNAIAIANPAMIPVVDISFNNFVNFSDSETDIKTTDTVIYNTTNSNIRKVPSNFKFRKRNQKPKDIVRGTDQEFWDYTEQHIRANRRADNTVDTQLGKDKVEPIMSLDDSRYLKILEDYMSPTNHSNPNKLKDFLKLFSK